MLDIKEHLKSLVEAHAPSGYEGAVRDLVRAAWTGLVDDFQQDKLGSLIGIKRASKPLEKPLKIMLAAHMDEIGLMVRDIVDGFLYVHRISGVDARMMMAQPVMVHGRLALPGVVATKPPHFLTSDERSKYPAFDDLIVDVGLPAEEVERLVRIGDLITPDVPLLELQGGRVAAKAMDDRACVAAVTFCLQELQKMQHEWDVYAVATTQEETGLYGAATAAYVINPDAAIALDVTFADQPGVDGDDASEMGAGPVITFGANIHPKLHHKLKEVARKQEIKHQDEYAPAQTGTDAWAIQVAREGIPTGLLSIPLRNMHSPVETLDLKDIERTGRLLAHFIASLDAAFLQSLSWQDEEEENQDEE